MTDPTPETTPTRDEAVQPIGRQERQAFELWAFAEWHNSNPPENAWKGWMARAQFAAKLASAPAPASGRVDAVAVKEALRWVDDNLSAAKSVMKKSAEAGNGYANFAAHDAHKHLTTIRSALSPAATPVSEAGPVAWRSIVSDMLAALYRYGHEVGDGDIPAAHRNLIERAELALVADEKGA